MVDVNIPEIGENITSGTVISILVNSGDAVTKGQDLIELETDKASLGVPSPEDGVIKEILIKEGDDVAVGATIIKMEAGATATAEAPKAAPAKEAPAEEPAPQAAVETPTSSSSSEQDTQLVVIGGGPGGYVAAFYAADLGLNVTLVNAEENPGGVCLYRGCIPSKALLHAAKILSEAKEAKDFGIDFGEPTVDINKLRTWKDKVVNQLTSGLGQLSKKRNVTYIQGHGSFVDSNTLNIKKADGSEQTLTFDKAILATGSRPIELPFAPKSPRVLDSTSALDIDSIPESMLLIGGGYIGLELGIVYAEMGTKLDVVEMLPTLIAGADRDIASVLEKRLKTLLDEIMVSTKVSKMEETKDGIKVTFEDKDGKAKEKTYEKVLVAIGRRPNSENIGLENTNVKVTDRGFVEVDAQRMTADPSIFAIGDIAGQPMLAHKASHEGKVAVETIAGKKAAFEPACIPAVVFTDPEIAWAGITETEAKEQGREVVVAKFPWGASGRALTLNRTDGLTKLVVEPGTERILGVSIVGPGAGELIGEAVLAIEMGSVVSDLAMSIHPHPTLTETMMESAESFFGHSPHMYRPKKK